MRFISLMTLTAAASLATAQLGRALQPNEVTPEQFEGKPALDIVVTSVEGKTVQLSDLRGKVVVLEFFVSWLPQEIERLPELQRLGEKYAKDLAVLPITREDNLIVWDFLEQRQLKLPIYVDSTGAANDAYLVTGPPKTVVIGKDGTVVRYFPAGSSTTDLHAALRKAGLPLPATSGTT